MKKGLEEYYRLHAGIYDMTRWSFLFGRNTIIDLLAERSSPARILEVGCGTGKNLLHLAKRFPEAETIGLDLSPDMLNKAQKKTRSSAGRINLVREPYNRPLEPGTFDIVIFSYSLSMMHHEWQTAIESAAIDLIPEGLIAVVDFHDTSAPIFRSWMHINHVRMEGHLLPGLKHLFAPEHSRIRSGYAGIWHYLTFIGKQKTL